MAASTASVAEPPPFKHFMAAWAALGSVSTNESKRPFCNDGKGRAGPYFAQRVRCTFSFWTLW